MALTIASPEIERLLDDVVQMTGESRMEAVRQALVERQERLTVSRTSLPHADRLHAFLEKEVWPRVPEEERGRRLTKEEEEALLR